MFNVCEGKEMNAKTSIKIAGLIIGFVIGWFLMDRLDYVISFVLVEKA